LVCSLQSIGKDDRIKANVARVERVDARDAIIDRKAERIFVGRIALKSFGRVGRIKVLANGSKAEA
jgi:hypothetical protein